MPCVFIRVAFTLEHMSKMAITFYTSYFYAATIDVGNSFNRTYYFLIKTWPAAARIEAEVDASAEEGEKEASKSPAPPRQAPVA